MFIHVQGIVVVVVVVGSNVVVVVVVGTTSQQGLPIVTGTKKDCSTPSTSPNAVIPTVKSTQPNG